MKGVDTMRRQPTQAIVNPTDGPVANAGKMQISGAQVLAVVPVLNEALHVEACVRSLMTGDERLRDVRLVVADGGSSDATREIVARLCAEFPNLSLIDNPGRLQAAAVNSAARECGQGRKVMVRCDAHAIYPSGYIMRVADSLTARGVESLATPMDAVGDSCFQRANAFIVDTPLGSGGSAHRGGRVSGFVDHGHHAGFDLAAFLANEGYDPTFSHNEDGEYDRRLRARGGRIFLDADIRLSYLPRDTAMGLARQYFNYGKGRARNLMKHGDLPRLRQMIPPATLAASVAGLLLAPIWLWTLVAPVGYLGLLVIASVYVALKTKSPCGLLAGAASAIMHMSWSAGFFRQTLSGRR